MSLRAVFFDAGETLLHPYPSYPELFAQVLREAGLKHVPDPGRIDAALVSARFAEAARDGELWTTSPEKSRRFWLSVYDMFLTEMGLSAVDGLPEALYARFTDMSSYRLFDDALPALERLRASGLILGIVSNFEAWLESLLERLGVTSLFAVRTISGIEGIEKPDPRIFLLALGRVGVAPDESVYVGDNPLFDTEPAEALGMQGVLLDRRGRFPTHSGKRIGTLDALPAAIGLEE